MTDELEKLLIKDLGNQAIISTLNVLRVGITFPIEASIAEKAESLVNDHAFNENAAAYLGYFYRLYKLNSTEPRSENADVLLVMRLIEHDVHDLLGIMETGFDFNDRITRHQKKLRNMAAVNDYLASIAVMSYFGETMAYIASSGCQKLQTQIPAKQALELLKMCFHEKIEDAGIYEANLNPAHIVSAYQLIKNALVVSKESPGLGVVDTKEFYIITVKDSGPGIQDTGGKPLPAQMIPEILKGYSTKNGGTGLQVVHRLVELQGGFIQIRTGSEGKSAIFYDTRKGDAEPSLIDISNGTHFMLYFRKSAMQRPSMDDILSKSRYGFVP